MKWLFICLLFFASDQKDSYYVSFIKGKVKLAKTKKLLKTGDEISLNDSLIFSAKNDLVALVSPEKGRHIVTFENKVRPYQKSQFILAVKDNYFPVTKINTLAARAGMINNLTDIKNYLKPFTSQSQVPMLLIDSVRIPLSTSFFTDRDDKFFFLQYQYGNDTINKKLSFRESVTGNDILYLLLSDEIYTIDGKQIEPDSVKQVALFYYDAKHEKKTETGAFKLHFVSEQTVLPQIKILTQALSELYQNEENKQALIFTQISSELQDYYGLPDKERLMELINRNE